MANIEKKDLDTRTFPEICASLSDSQWLTIRDSIKAKTEKTDQAIYKWRDGKCIPMSIQERKVVSEIVNRVLDIRTNFVTLFRV